MGAVGLHLRPFTGELDYLQVGSLPQDAKNWVSR